MSLEAGASGDRLYVRPDEAEDFVRRLLAAHDVPAEDAAVVAGCLVLADLRGVDSHGLGLLPLYLRRVRAGLVNARPRLAVTRVTPVTAALDGDNGFGFVVATRGVEEAVGIAREFGIGLVSARRSTHFGMAASYVLQAIDAGFIGMVFTNASRAIPPHGGREAIFGTSPLAFGAPGGSGAPYVLDMSPAVAARGKIRRAARRGEAIPQGYALDSHGRPTTDPQEALDGGVILPLGGPKGSALSMLMDILGGVLSGAGFAGGVRSQFDDWDAPQDVGHFFLAIRPDLFVPLEEYRRRMDVLVERVHGCPPAEGFGDVLLPGEPEARERERRTRSGIPYSSAEVDALAEEAGRVGLPPLTTRPAPLDVSPTG